MQSRIRKFMENAIRSQEIESMAELLRKKEPTAGRFVSMSFHLEDLTFREACRPFSV